MALLIFLTLAAFALYFLPTIVAASRSVPNGGSVLIVNFFLGWTFVGWVIALAMACRSLPAVNSVQVTQMSGAGYQETPPAIQAPLDPPSPRV